VKTIPDQNMMLETPPSGPSGVERRFGLAGVFGALGVEATPVRCGKFELKQKLGEGAMGVVYVATDGELGRDVALKLLRTTRGYESLRREARALARLNHPNVVQVLGVGEAEGQTWIAMELIEGGTLAEWSEVHPPAGRERYQRALDLLLAAGRGLAAAHGAGLVHRDFKPANVLVGLQGQAKVADFGLARSYDEHVVTPPVHSLERTRAADTLDRTGLVVGTPLYMSAELHLGARADTSSDQFAFAVSAWQVLHGKLPFVGKNQHALLDALEAGQPRPTPRDTYTVGAVTQALRRAMDPDPAARHPSMDALLDAMSKPPRRRWWALGALGVAAVVGLVATPGSAPNAACRDAGARSELDQVWNASRREQIRAALVGSGASYAETTWATVEQAIEGFGQRWVAQHVGACEAARDRGTAAQRQRDATMWCLSGQLQEVDAFLQRLGQAESKALERAVSVADQLPRPAVCEQPGEGDSGYGSPLARELQAELARARASSSAGDFESAVQIALEVRDRAQAAGLSTVVGDAQLRAGSAMLELDDPDAIAMVEAAYDTAVSHSQWSAAAGRASRLVGAYKSDHQLDRARTWLRHASVALQRAPDPVLQARVLRAECLLLDEEDRHDEALEACERGLTAVKDVPSASYIRTQLISKMASLRGNLGQFDAAIAMLQQLRDEARSRWGLTHPRAGGMALNLGVVAKRAKKYELATSSFREAAEVFKVAYGPKHSWVASAYLNLSSAYIELEDFVQAEQAVLAGLEVMDGREDAKTARLLHNQSSIRRYQGRNAEAVDLMLEVVAIETKVLPLDHPQTGFTHHNLGMAYMNLDRLDDAQREFDRAKEIYARGTGPYKEGKLRTAMSELAERRGEPEQALEHAEAAAALFATLDVQPIEGPVVLARAAALHAEAGSRDAAKARLAQLEATNPHESELLDALLARARTALEASDG
jgi:tetratricopeptide (TPR) repeat protein